MNLPNDFRLIRHSCGLTREEMADALDVRFDTLRAWDSGQRPAPEGALKDARALYQLIIHASGQLGARIDALKGRPLKLGLAGSETAARKLGFPAMAAQHAAVGFAVAALRDDVAAQVELVPWRDGIETADATPKTEETALLRRVAAQQPLRSQGDKAMLKRLRALEAAGFVQGVPKAMDLMDWFVTPAGVLELARRET